MADGVTDNHEGTCNLYRPLTWRGQLLDEKLHILHFTVDEKAPILGVGVALADGVADHDDGGPVRLQEQLAGRLLQQPVKRGRRASKHFYYNTCLLFCKLKQNIILFLKLFHMNDTGSISTVPVCTSYMYLYRTEGTGTYQ